MCKVNRRLMTAWPTGFTKDPEKNSWPMKTTVIGKQAKSLARKKGIFSICQVSLSLSL